MLHGLVITNQSIDRNDSFFPRFFCCAQYSVFALASSIYPQNYTTPSMASTQSAVVATTLRETPYQLDLTQTTRACSVLLKHINEERQRREIEADKPNLLAQGDEDNEDEDADGDDVPVWMIMTTKKHIVDVKRLKPSKM